MEDTDFGLDTIDLSQFAAVFFEECTEHLAEMERLLLEIDPSCPDQEALHALFRAAHSIKGSGGIFDFSDMTAITHELESVLDLIRNQQLALTPEMVNLFLQSTDVISMQLAGHRNGAEVDQQASNSACAGLRAILADFRSAPREVTANPVEQDAVPAAGLQKFTIDFIPSQDIFKRGIRIENLFGELASLGTLSSVAEFPEVPELHEFDPEIAHTHWHLSLETEATAEEIRDIFIFVADDSDIVIKVEGPQAQPAPLAVPPGQSTLPATHEPTGAKNSREAVDGSIRVGVRKVDQIINQVGELVITQAMLSQIGGSLDPVLHADLYRGLQQLARNTRDLQESVMSMRLVPINLVFNRFPRLIRDLAAKLGKQVELKVFGENTELDKGLVEKMSDPLTHLVRNALDHAIETPDVRIAAGKPAMGTVTLRASQIGGKIVVDVVDDGAGLNRERILCKAAERGIDVNEGMSDEEVWQLIFTPGFSTADTVTDLSGRGVGMDVVSRNVQALGGRVQIFSKSGEGTRITLSLPLTLAILDGLSVAVGSEKFIIPINAIVESLQPSASDIQSIQESGKVLRMRGDFIPVIPLHELFAIKEAASRPEESVLVVVDAEGERVALQVDALVDEQQVVIKSLEENYRKVPGTAGATIMGDGRVALILDVGEIACQWHGRLKDLAA